MEDLPVDERTELQRIGDGLDARLPLRVLNGGIVILDEHLPLPTVQEQNNEQQRKPQRSAARSRKGSSSRKGPPRRQGAARSEARIVGLADAYHEQLDAVRVAYPGTEMFSDTNGVWLVSESSILEALDRSALFVVALPNVADIEPRGWAFWKIDETLRWIGPRHTNMVDGSVCAFHSKFDNAWNPGGDLRTLLDIYSVWALRHLHLEFEKRWPGEQYAMPDASGSSDPYYRLVQFQPDELCSCGSYKTYGSCCRPADLRLPFMAIKGQFDLRNGGARLVDRSPPTNLVSALERHGDWALPPIANVHIPLKLHLSN